METESIEINEYANIDISDKSQRAKWIVYVIWAIIILNSMAVVSSYMELELLERCHPIILPIICVKWFF